jgi:hypothetical protein
MKDNIQHFNWIKFQDVKLLVRNLDLDLDLDIKSTDLDLD